MINLFYLTSKLHDEGFTSFVAKELFAHLDPSVDLVISSNADRISDCISCLSLQKEDSLTSRRYNHLISFIECNSFIDSDSVDIEKIANQKLRNVVLLNFDTMDQSILRCLINKSKKTEILGISTQHTDYFQFLQMEIYKYLQKGFSKKQVSVMMILEHGCPSELIEQCLNNIKFHSSKVQLKSIRFPSDIINYVKTE